MLEYALVADVLVPSPRHSTVLRSRYVWLARLAKLPHEGISLRVPVERKFISLSTNSSGPCFQIKLVISQLTHTSPHWLVSVSACIDRITLKGTVQVYMRMPTISSLLIIEIPV